MTRWRRTKSGLTLSASLDENAKVSDTLVERLSALSESSGESVVNEGVLQTGTGEAGHKGRREGKKAKVKQRTQKKSKQIALQFERRAAGPLEADMLRKERD